MNRFLKSFFFFAVLLSFTFSSCTVGLGEAVDLEAPKITLTYPVIKPGTITYIPRSIELMGTCTDNKKVKAVLVRYSYTLNGTEHSKEENAVIDGEKWSLTISVAYDIDLQVEITASDEGGNTSENSVVSFMACVDAENPEVTEIAVKKNGQQTTLKEKSELAAVIESESASKDDLQNEEFSIIASLVDNNGVKSSRLTIFDGDKAILEDLPPDNEGSDNYNQYKPVWTIKASDLEAVDSSYKKGRHYFVPAVSVEDDAGNGKNKECVTYGNYLAWESSTDKPKISFPLASGENKMNIGKGTKIPVVIFDDDGINEVLYSLVPASEYKGSAEATYRENSSLFSKIENISGRDYNFTLNDVSSLGNYFLTVVVKYKKQITG